MRARGLAAWLAIALATATTTATAQPATPRPADTLGPPKAGAVLYQAAPETPRRDPGRWLVLAGGAALAAAFLLAARRRSHPERPERIDDV